MYIVSVKFIVPTWLRDYTMFVSTSFCAFLFLLFTVLMYFLYSSQQSYLCTSNFRENKVFITMSALELMILGWPQHVHTCICFLKGIKVYFESAVVVILISVKCTISADLLTMCNHLPTVTAELISTDKSDF